MNLKRFTSFVMVLLLLVTTACTGLSSPDAQTATPPVAALQPSPLPSPATLPTVIPTRAQPTVVPVAVEGVYLINQRATSTRSAFEEINLVLYRATLSGDRLILRVGFHNVSDKSFYLTAAVDVSDLRLVDAAG